MSSCIKVFLLLTSLQIAIQQSRTTLLSGTCSTRFRELQYSIQYIDCPQSCWHENANLCGSGPYGNGSICEAALHASMISNYGGLVKVYKAGIANLIGSTNTTTRTSSCSNQQAYSFAMTCTTNGETENSVNRVFCPPGCNVGDVCGYDNGFYNIHSSVCRAAVHSGAITEASGGFVTLYKLNNLTLTKSTLTKNGVKSTDTCPNSNYVITFNPDGANVCANQHNVCKNGATCVNGIDWFYCACADGYEGIYCENDTDECISQPCKHNGTCNNKIANYTCSCPIGFKGANCETIETYCEPGLCSNGAICNELRNNYSCQCVGGFEGRHCDVAPSPCLSITCNVTNSFCNSSLQKCQCLPGYEPPNCKLSCDSSTLETENGKYNFNKTLSGYSTLSQETCKDGRPLASVSCIKTNKVNLATAEFGDLVVVSCDLNATSIFLQKSEALSTFPTQKETETILSSLNVAVQPSKTKPHLTQREQTSAVKVLEYIANTNVTVQPFSLFEAMSVANIIVDTLSQGTTQVQDKREKTESLKQVLNTLASRIKIQSGQNTIKLQTTEIQAQVSIPKPLSNGKFENVTFEGTSSSGNKVTALIKDSAFEALNKSNGSPRVSFFLYKNQQQFFPTSQIVSDVLTVNVANASKLEGGIQVKFQLPNNSNAELIDKYRKLVNITQTYCTIWDSKKFTFKRIHNTKEGVQLCDSRSVGSFAVLFRSEILPSSRELGYFTFVGLSLSCVGLALTTIIYLTVRELRSRQPTVFLLNICICLLVVDLTFLLGVSNKRHYIACYISTIILHYFLLATWFWMTANAFNMHRAIVKVVKGLSPTLWKYCAFICYFCPLCIVGISSSVAIFLIDPHRQEPEIFPFALGSSFYKSSYKAVNLCWLNFSGNVIQFAFFAPVGILAAVNLVFCTLITVTLTCKRTKIQSTAQRSKSDELIIVLTLILMMGLTWVFGFLSLWVDNIYYIELMSWLFTILNTLQGLLIFFLNCVRQPKVRALWINPMIAMLPCCPKYQSIKHVQQNSSSSAQKTTSLTKKENQQEQS